MSKQNQFNGAYVATLVAVFSLVLISGNNDIFDQHVPSAESGFKDFAGAVEAAQLGQAELTGKLVTWISEQCEQMAQEMDAIIRLEAVESTERFSVVNYLRYLAVYDQMRIVAKRTDVDQFRWIAKKVKAYRMAYDAAGDILLKYLHGLDASLALIEANERKGKQESVKRDWVQIYETVNYIATHAPNGSQLKTEAYEVLQTSPNGTEEKKRSTRYSLYVRVN